MAIVICLGFRNDDLFERNISREINSFELLFSDGTVLTGKFRVGVSIYISICDLSEKRLYTIWQFLTLLTHFSKLQVEVWNVGIVSKEHGSDPLCPSDIQNGFVHMIDHGGPVLTASLAPDGTALATAGTSGDVKFFEVCLHESIPPR